MSTKKDLTNIDIGYTWNFHAEYEDSDGNPIDLTGHTVRMVISRINGDEVADLECTVGPGSIDLSVPDEVTGTWPSAPMEYSLEHHQPDGNIYRLVRGAFKVVN